MPATAGVRHVLLDADGVLQTGPRDPFDVLRSWAGERAEELAQELWALEQPALRGDGDFAAVVAEVVPRHADADPDEVYAALWEEIEVCEESLALVRALRASGVGVHLGTNQHRERGDRMRHVLGYDDLFDVSCYSWEMGVAKPDPAFFATAVDRIGAAPGEVLFVDDRVDNVEAARAVGLVGVHWDLAHGHEVLRRELGGHGLEVPLA